MPAYHGNYASHNEMLKNFDVLIYEDFSSQQLKQLPSLAKAHEHLRDELVRDSENKPYELWCDLSEFKKYGPGVFLAFYFLKYVIVVMGCLLLFPLINMVICITEENTFNGMNMETVLQSTTISSLESPEGLVVALNFTVLLCLTLAMVYWPSLQTRLVLECTEVKSLSSYYTVIMTNIPNYYSQEHLKEHLQKHYGDIREIYSPKNYQEDLLDYRKMCDLINYYKQQRQIYLKGNEERSCLAMARIFADLRHMHQQLSNKITANKIYQPYCAFVTFENVHSKSRLLSEQGINIKRCCQNEETRRTQEEKLYKGQELQFKSCEMEPDGIIWQNLNVSASQKTWRRVVISILLTIYLFVAVTIFFVIAAADASLYSDQYDDLPQEQIMSSNNARMIRSFCLELGLSNFYSYSECKPYLKAYISHFILYLSFPVVVIVLKWAFGLLIMRLVKFRRHKYMFYQIKWEIVIITLFYFIKTGFIKIFIYRSFHLAGMHIELLSMFQPLLQQVSKIVPSRPDFIHLYHDFDAKWVAHASHKIILIGMVSFNIPILLFFLNNFVTRRCKESKARTMPTQSQMNSQLRGQQFNIEFLYAEFLSLFLFCMLYFSCIPLLYPLVYVSLVLLYWVVKYKLIRLDRKPPVYSHAINQLAVKTVLVGLLINSLFAPMCYGGLEQGDSSTLDRLTTYWYYLLNAVIIVFFGFLRKKTLKVCSFLKLQLFRWLCRKQEDEGQINDFKTMQSQFNGMQAAERGLQSYSMHSNKEYAQLLRLFYTLNRKQIHQFSYLSHKDVDQLKHRLEQDPNSFHLLDELCSFLEAQISRHDKYGRADSRDRAKCMEYLQMLKDLRQSAQKEIKEIDDYKTLYKEINSRLKEMNSLHSFVKSGCLSSLGSSASSTKGYPEGQSDAIIEDDVQTGVRLKAGA